MTTNTAILVKCLEQQKLCSNNKKTKETKIFGFFNIKVKWIKINFLDKPRQNLSKLFPGYKYFIII